MSNHLSAAMLNFRCDDSRSDLRDLFVFASSESPGETGLNVEVNPFMTGADFNPEAIHRVNIGKLGPAWQIAVRKTPGAPAGSDQVLGE